MMNHTTLYRVAGLLTGIAVSGLFLAFYGIEAKSLVAIEAGTVLGLAILPAFAVMLLDLRTYRSR